MSNRHVIEYSQEAQKDLSRLDNKVVNRILDKLEFFRDQDDPLVFAKSLQGSFKGSYRFRIGDYRVIFDYLDSGEIIVLMVLNINHRKDSYR